MNAPSVSPPGATTYPVADPLAAAPVRAQPPAPWLSPEERVAASRSGLRLALMTSKLPAPKTNSLADKVKHFALDVPLVQLVIDRATSKWKNHPLHGAAQMAGQATQIVAWPLARRFPLRFLGSIAAATLVVFLLKPWRLLFKPRVLFGAASFLATPLIKRWLLEFSRRAVSGSKQPAQSTAKPFTP